VLATLALKKEVANIDSLSKDEKQNGIESSLPHFVKYDKGDKGGNRWYLETHFLIEWSKETVTFLKSNSGKSGEGMPVVRNPQFYFKDGLCWSDIHTVLIKARLKSNGVYDVKSMSLFSLSNEIPNWYIVCILNSTFISNYDFHFINNTQTFQINDARQIPIVIPTRKKLSEFEEIFNQAIIIKKKFFRGDIDSKEEESLLNKIQTKLDVLVYDLYNIKSTEN